MSLAYKTPISRALAIGLLIVPIAVVYFLLIAPLRENYLNNQQELANYSRQLANYKAIANSREKIEKLIGSMRPSSDVKGYYLNGSTRALASAELQTYLRTIIESSKGNLVSTQPTVKNEQEPERIVKVSVRMSGTIESLLQVFYRISTGVPVLLTDEVLIRRGNASSARSTSESGDGTLDIQFTVTGFVKESVS